MTTAERTDIERSPLRYLHDTQVSLEKFRIQLGNRVEALARGDDDAVRPVPEAYRRVSNLAIDMEAEIDKAIAEELRNWPVYEYWLKHVKGIGPSLAGQMLALLLPPIPTKGPSSWTKAAGLDPQPHDGEMRLPRPRKGGGTITYHPYLRRCLHNVATSFVRTGGYYRQSYEEAKARLVAQHAGQENWPPYRMDAVARWVLIRLFLSHLWEMWCEAEGIHNRGPYGMTVLADGTRVIRETFPDGSYRDHAYQAAPRPTGKGKM